MNIERLIKLKQITSDYNLSVEEKDLINLFGILRRTKHFESSEFYVDEHNMSYFHIYNHTFTYGSFALIYFKNKYNMTVQELDVMVKYIIHDYLSMKYLEVKPSAPISF